MPRHGDNSILGGCIIFFLALVFLLVPPSEYEEIKKMCESPADKSTKILCEAFTILSQNLGTGNVFSDSMEMFEGEPVENVCALMKQSFDVLSVLPTENSFRKPLSSPKWCQYRCGEVYDDNPDEVIVLPICKVIAFQLGSLMIEFLNNNKNVHPADEQQPNLKFESSDNNILETEDVNEEQHTNIKSNNFENNPPKAIEESL